MTPAVALKYDPKTLPDRMKTLPVDDRGYIVPRFVGYVDGKPDFRIMDRQFWQDAVVKSLCWVCGERLGIIQVFTIGPMCAVNRTTAEPPSHRECAIWSAKNCPFLTRPHMVRREDEVTAQCQSIGGVSIRRNPGVVCLWFTRDYKVFRDNEGKPLIQVGEPDHIEWYAEGRKAKRAQVLESIRTGLPFLEEMATGEGPEAVRELRRMMYAAGKLLPRE